MPQPSAPSNDEKDRAQPAITVGTMLGGSLRTPYFALLGLALVVAWFFYGWLEFYGVTDRITTLGWWWNACNSANDWVHGRFVPLAIVGLIYLDRKRLLKAPMAPSNWGLAVVIVGCLFFVLSIRTLQPRIAVGAIPFIALGASLFVFGMPLTKRITFPFALVYFAIPLPGLTQATTKLQIIATQTAYHISKLLGADITVAGNTIKSANDSWPGITSANGLSQGFDIAEGCSGIRSLIALTFIAAIYAHLTQNKLWKKILLFAASIPLALVANGLRVTTIILIAEYWDAQFAGEAYHNFSGFLFFPLGLIGLILVDLALNKRLPFIGKKNERRVKVRKASAQSNP
jgi:exosortase